MTLGTRLFGGEQSMSLAELSAILAVTVQPLSADFTGTCFIQLYLYAHRVGYNPASTGSGPGVPSWSGDQRVAAAGLSLG